MLTLWVCAAYFQNSADFLAVQEWEHGKLRRAWSMDGKPLKATIAVNHGTSNPPRVGPAVELIAGVHCIEGDEFPAAYWKIEGGLKGYSSDDGWKDHDASSKTAAFSLFGFPKRDQGSVVLFVASGPSHQLATPKALPIDNWADLGNGFRGKLLIKRNMNDLKVIQDQAVLNLQLPQRYLGWEIKPVLSSAGTPLGRLGQPNCGNKELTFKFESAPGPKGTLVIMGRPYSQTHFNHVRLTPEPLGRPRSSR